MRKFLSRDVLVRLLYTQLARAFPKTSPALESTQLGKRPFKPIVNVDYVTHFQVAPKTFELNSMFTCAQRVGQLTSTMLPQAEWRLLAHSEHKL